MVGIDPGEEVSAFCRERGLRVFRGTLDEAPLTAGQVDCVAVWNTFDQLPDPRPVLTAARRLLRSDGVLALRVPNGNCFRWAVCRMRWLPSPLAGWLRAAMAWNNLLAFPYLYGYSVRTLDRLLAGHCMSRFAARPDTLPPLADAQTRRWAAAEEWALKRLCRLTGRLDACRAASRLTLAPWFDAYYRSA
jgi:SAM-dependent methyltransferase